MRGRRPKPTTLKLLQGNPGRRPINADEPSFPALESECPAHLGTMAAAEWTRMKELFKEQNIFTEADRAALAAYCLAWGRWVEAENQVRQSGMLVKSPSGYPMQNPWLSIANKAMEQMNRLTPEFGFTPSSRSKIKTLPEKKKPKGTARFFT
jgi:P27 family predicted phage terminase small subunit